MEEGEGELELSPFFAFIFLLFPQNRLILRLGRSGEQLTLL